LAKKPSTALSQEHDVGVKWKTKRGWRVSHPLRREMSESDRQSGLFLEQEANELFAPVENHLTRLGRILHEANAVVEINPTWEHFGEQKLRRAARVIFGGAAEFLPLYFTIERVIIFYRDRHYRFTSGIEALIPVITSDVEQFITAQSQAAAPAHLALTSDPPLLVEHLREIIEP
jgi:hypothetical protein